MVYRPGYSRKIQWFWAVVFMIALAFTLLLGVVMRDTEYVTPDVVQQDWVESKEKR